jgi:putative membrane protein
MSNGVHIRLNLICLGAFFLLALLVYTGLHAYDTLTWFMEVFPVLIALSVILFTYRRFPLTSLLYVVILLHCIVLIFGGMYTYARVPFGFEIAQWFDLTRNPYDKIGHFMQGFAPALIAREILIRGNYVNGRRMLNFIVICIVLAISASYELIEWGAALWMGQGADEFLGTQGDIWDTQSDMFFALIGSTVAIGFFSHFHDRLIKKV